MKFSEMLGEPDPDREVPEDPEPISVFSPAPAQTPPVSAVDYPPLPPDPVSAVDYPPLPPDPVSPTGAAVPGPAMPAPPLSSPPSFATPGADAPRSGLAELNVLSPATAPTEPVEGIAPVTDLAGLTVVDDDLLPSARRARK